MDYLTAFDICGSAMTAQRTKLDIVTSNLANAETTNTPEGGPYKRRRAILSAESPAGTFGSVLQGAVNTVKIERIVEDESVKMVYDPAHPDADAKGFVAKPNINPVEEMADLITTSRNFEAVVTAFDATKNMALKALDIGK